MIVLVLPKRVLQASSCKSYARSACKTTIRCTSTYRDPARAEQTGMSIDSFPDDWVLFGSQSVAVTNKRSMTYLTEVHERMSIPENEGFEDMQSLSRYVILNSDAIEPV